MTIMDDVTTLKARITKRIETLEFKLAVQKELLSEIEHLRPTPKRTTNSTKPQTVPGSMVSRIRKVLQDSETPLKVAQIADAITANSNTENMPTNLKSQIATNLTRRPDLFVRVDRGLYALKSRASKALFEQ